MVQLPSAADYGGRPSLNVRRVDRPSTGGANLAATALAAATQLKAVMDQNRERENALNYTLARNEVQQLSLEEQQKLVDDPDWGTHGERFSAGMTAGVENIRKKYKLSPRDSQVFDSEASLIGAKADINVAGRSRVLEVKEATGRWKDGQANARESIQSASEGERNDIILGELDAIQAMVDANLMDADTAAIERERMTQDFALASLSNMSSEDQIRLITASLAHRKGFNKKSKGKNDSGAGALTADDIRNGLGTGSIADFLHADTANKMLELAKNKDKDNKNRIASQDAGAKARDLYPEDELARAKFIRDNYEGAVEELALTDDAQRSQRERNAELRHSEDLRQDLTDQILHDDLDYTTISPDILREMTDADQWAVKQAYIRKHEEDRFALVTRTTRDPKKPFSMSEEQWNDLDDYGSLGKTSQNLDHPMYWEAFTAKEHANLVIEQEGLRKLEGERILTGDQDPRAMINRHLEILTFTVPDDKGDAKLNSIKARLETQFRQKITSIQNSTTPPTELDEAAREKILAELLSPMAFTNTEWWTAAWSDNSMPVALMSRKQREDAYVHLSNLPLTKSEDGRLLSIEQILDKMVEEAKLSKPSHRNKQRAAFAFVNNIGATPEETIAEVMRRLKGE